MRIRKLALARRISDKGVLSLDVPDVQEFCRQHCGKSVIVRIELLPTEVSQKSLAYYWKVAVPTIQRGLYELGYELTQKQTDKFIREQMPICHEERWEGILQLKDRIRKPEELDTAEFNEMMEQLKIWAAENLQVYVEEPCWL